MSGPKHANSRSWKPGTSGNPSGRLKGVEQRYRSVAETRSYAAKDGKTYTGLEALANVLLDIAFDGNEQAKDRRAAADSYVDRGWGKVKESVEITNGVSPQDQALLEAMRLTPHERRIAAQDSTVPEDVQADEQALDEMLADEHDA